VDGCVGKLTTKWNLKVHFRGRHPADSVWVPGQGIHPKCEWCGLQIDPRIIPSHWQTEHSKEKTARQTQYEAAVQSGRALRQTFTIYDKNWNGSRSSST